MWLFQLINKDPAQAFHFVFSTGAAVGQPPPSLRQTTTAFSHTLCGSLGRLLSAECLRSPPHCHIVASTAAWYRERPDALHIQQQHQRSAVAQGAAFVSRGVSLSGTAALMRPAGGSGRPLCPSWGSHRGRRGPCWGSSRAWGPGKHQGPLTNLPIPPGALSDPWEALNVNQLFLEPLDAPTPEVLAELNLEVARQIRLQMRRDMVESVSERGPPVQQKSPSTESDSVKGPPFGQEEDPSPTEAHEAPPPCAVQGPPVRPYRPIVLPPPSLNRGDPPDAEETDNGNGAPTFLPPPAAANKAGRGFVLPAATEGAAGASHGTAVLSLDEEGIKKRLRLNAEASV